MVCGGLASLLLVMGKSRIKGTSSYRKYRNLLFQTPIVIYRLFVHSADLWPLLLMLPFRGLSVCLFVTFVRYAQTAKNIDRIFCIR